MYCFANIIIIIKIITVVIIDYIDRGSNSVEVVILLLALKVLYPHNIFLLRGNHELAQMNSNGTFVEDCLFINYFIQMI